MAGSTNWTEVSASPFEWERDALAFVRERFPDSGAYRAWSNFEFIDHDGSINEVDLLVFSPRGAFLVEIKSWPEPTSGDAGTWTRTYPNGRRRALDNPLLLTNRKAKRLKSLLDEQARKRGEGKRPIPFMAPLVFLSHPEISVGLSDTGRQGVCVRDADTDEGRAGLPGIVQAVKRITDADKRRRGFRPWSTKDADRFADLLDAVGIRETNKHRRAGDWLLGELIEEGVGWQEFAGSRTDAPDVKRRVRIFGSGSTVERSLISAAAKREFQALEPIEHPGILAPKDLLEAEQGPALLYPALPDAVRLDHYLGSSGARLSIQDRLSLVRQLSEALAYAHDRGIRHRALRPSSVLIVDPESEQPELMVRDWHLASRSGGGEQEQTGTLTAHVDVLIEQEADVYLAPEAGRSKSGVHLDVFGLGALAFLIFSGRQPAPSLIERESHLRQHGGLDLAAVVDGAGDAQRLSLLQATNPQVSERTPTVKAFLVDLDAAEEELTAEKGADASPESAGKGEFLAGYEVESRLGRGATAIAYLVSDNGEPRVLKIAANPKNNGRLVEEGEALAQVRDPSVVALRRAGIDVGGHAALLLDFAGRETLAERIKRDGPPGLELLERWGEDLIRAVAALESQGVAHRDIKPANIGIRNRPPKDQLRPTLFDFSLSRAPLEAISAGTPDYIDPFLREASRGRWDLAAERFSLAVTLHEMATGQLPHWGDGMSDPLTVDEEVDLDEALLDPGVAPKLGAFFRRALARDASERFDSAEDMLRAWRTSFSEAAAAPGGEPDKATLEQAFGMATPLSPIGELPFSARARSALRGAGIATAGDLIASSVFELRSLTGVGASTRDEIIAAHTALRDRIATDDAPDVQSLDMLSRQLVPTKGWPETDIETLRAFLGLEGEPWRPVARLAEDLGRAHADVQRAIDQGRERWYKTLKSARRLADEIVDQLGEPGFLPMPMLEEAVLASRGAVAQGEERERLIGACVRAALEAEQFKESPRFALARENKLLLLSRTSEPDPGASLRYLTSLAARLDQLVTDAPVPAERASVALAEIEAPTAASIQPERLCRLAVHASTKTAINDRGEVYPVGLTAATAAEHCAGNLVPPAHRTFSIEEIDSRVRARYPEAEELPARPALDSILSQIGLEWRPSDSGYGARQLTESATRWSHGSTSDLDDRGMDRFGARLDRDRNRFLALTAYTRFTADAERKLSKLDGIQVVSLDNLLIRHMREVAAENGARWDAVIGVDEAAEKGSNWSVIQRVAKEACDRARSELLQTPRTVLLSNGGLLERYGRMDFLQELRRQLQEPADDTVLEGLWLLVPTESKDGRPMIGSQPVPVLDSNEWTHVPRQWIQTPLP